MSISNSLDNLINDLNSIQIGPHNLRAVPARRAQRSQSWSRNGRPTHGQVPSRQNRRGRSISPVSKRKNLIHLLPNSTANMATAVIQRVAKFCGKVDKSNPDKERLESYTVDQWIRDVESLHTNKRVTGEKEKIQEALLLVNNEHGDAHQIITTGMLSRIDTFKDFKEKSLILWRQKAQTDAFFNLVNAQKVPYADNLGNYLSQIETMMVRVKDDMIRNSKMITDKPGKFDKNKLVVGLDEVVRYMSYGAMFLGVPDAYKKALKKNEIDPTKDSVTLFNDLERETEKNVLKFSENFTGVTERTSGNNRNNNQYSQQRGFQNNWRGQNNRGRQPNNTQGYQGNYQGGNYYGPQNGNNRGGRGGSYRGNRGSYNRGHYQNSGFTTSYANRGNRGAYSNSNRGAYSNSNRGSYNSFSDKGSWTGTKPKVQCNNCGRTNHATAECITCSYCGKYGHYHNDCYSRIKAMEQQKNPPLEGNSNANPNNNNNNKN